MAAGLLETEGMGRVGVTLALAATLAGGCMAARPTPPAVAPAALPTSVIAPDQRVVAYPHGRWQLYGDGGAASPYTWVWIPAGSAPPSPAPPTR
jgi:hypothetical protein